MPSLLQVWSFEERLTNKDKEDLLKYFGAVNVQHVTKHGKDKVALASFKSDEDCEYAMRKLHQKEVLGRRLMAVYKDGSPPIRKQPHLECTKEEEKIQKPAKEETMRKKIREFENRLSAIAANFDIKYPIPPHLKYLYPPPSASIIANIVQTLLVVPKFYTQVLHLMNKMNLPAPFGNLRLLPTQYLEVLKLLDLDLEKTQPCPEEREPQKSAADRDKQVPSADENESSETESELESDSDEARMPMPIVRPIKRKKKPTKIMNKKPNFSLLKQTCVSHPRTSLSSVNEAFEGTDSVQSRKLELRLKGTLPSETSVGSFSEELEPGGFGKMEAVREPVEKAIDNPVEWKGESSKYISKEELQKNRINKADWAILPVFKNYRAGEPSLKLYIKNLAKTTSEADLKYIYGSYVFWHNEEEASMFSIRLMKEGRMKGQAFVTFPSTEKATEALNDTNGYILNDKPMVVAFGKVKGQQPPST